jgi:outer membrane receptor protein involved in Fe transport
MKTSRYFLACTALLSLLSASAMAQDTEQRTIAEVIVTAQRRAESVRDVPIAISVVSGKDLDAMGATDFMDFARTVPGVQFRAAGAGRTKLSIRGVSSNTGAATVGYYIDDVPIPSNNGFVSLVTIDPKLFDIQRVEVLRGPQGTLYGAGSMGGTIKYIMNSPDSTAFDGRFRLSSSGTTNGDVNGSFDGMFNAPLVANRLAARLVGYYHNDSGFIDRIYDPPTGPPQDVFITPNDLLDRTRHTANQITWGGRGVLDWTPTDNSRISLSIMHQRTEMDGLPYVTGGPTNPDLLREFRQPLNVPEPFTDQFTLAALTGSVDFGNWNATAIASHFNRKFNMTEDGTIHLDRFFYEPLGGPILPGPLEEITDQDSTTYEARLSTKEPWHGLNALIGYFNQHRTPDRAANWVVPGANAAYEPLGLPLPNDNFYTSATEGTADEEAVFGELSYAIFDTLKITAGFRYFDLKNESTSVFDGLFGNGGAESVTNFSATDTNYRFALSWEPSTEAMLYASAAAGLRPGTGVGFLPDICDAELAALGFDPNNPPQQVDPDSVWSYEVGAKTDWLDRRLAVNLAVFDIEWKDIQQTLFLQCGFNILVNAGKARSKGVELELVAAPTDRLTLTASYSYTDATLQTDAPDVGGEKGDWLQDVPRTQAAGSITYEYPILQGYKGSVRTDVQYVGKSYVTFDQNNPLETKPSYTLVNFSLGVSTPGRWLVTFFVDNVTDKQAILAHPDSLIFNLADLPRYSVNRPRTIGLRVERSFKP